MIIQDADLEYLPKDIPKIISPILRGEADAVYGSRFLGTVPSMRRSHLVANQVLTLAMNLVCGTRLTDMMTGYKAFKRAALNGAKLKGKGFELEPEITAIASKRRLRLIEVPISYKYREKGRTKMRWIDGIRCLWWILRMRTL